MHEIGHVLVGRVEPLGDEQAEQILGVEIGRVQRIDVGAERARPSPPKARALSVIAAIWSSSALTGARPRALDPGGVDIGRVVIGDPRWSVPAAGIGLHDAVDQLAVALLALLVVDAEAADAANGPAGISVFAPQAPLA